MKLVFIRHGQTASNVSGALDTAFPGADLNEDGKSQAQQLVGKYLELVGDRPEAIFASDLVRTRQTITPLAKHFGIQVQIRPGLREVSAGNLEMRTDQEAVKLYLGAVLEWVQGNLSVPLGQGETGEDVRTRFFQVLQEVEDACGEGTALVCAHGAVLRLISHWLSPQQIPLRLIGSRPLANTGIAVLEGSFQQGWKALLWNDKPVDFWPLPSELSQVLPSQNFLEKKD